MIPSILALAPLLVPWLQGAAPPTAIGAARTVVECETVLTHAAIDSGGALVVLATTTGELQAWSLDKKTMLWKIAPPVGPDPATNVLQGLAVGQKFAMVVRAVPVPECVDLAKGTLHRDYTILAPLDRSKSMSMKSAGITCEAKDHWAWLATEKGVLAKYIPNSPRDYSRRRIDDAEFSSIASDSDQVVAIGCEDGSIRFAKGSGGSVDEKRVFRGPASAVTALAFAGKGGEIVSGAQDGTVTVWSPSGGKPKRQLKAGDARIVVIAVNPKAKWIAAGDEKGAIRLWHLSSGAELGTLPPEADSTAVRALFPIEQGKALAIVRGGKRLLAYDIAKP